MPHCSWQQHHQLEYTGLDPSVKGFNFLEKMKQMAINSSTELAFYLKVIQLVIILYNVVIEWLNKYECILYSKYAHHG